VVSIWKPATRPGYKIRVTLPDGRAITTMLGTHSVQQARRMRRFFTALEDDRKWAALALVVEGQLTPGALYDARERIDALVSEFAQVDADVDLEPLVAEWGGRGMSRRGRGVSHAEYVRQVRTLMPAGEPFARSRFTRKKVAEWLDGLSVEDPTRNRYKAALNQFARFLIERDVLELNPVSAVLGYSEPQPDLVYLSVPDAKALVDALEGEAQLVAALMATSCSEWGPIERGHRRHLDFGANTFHATGSKNRHRNRLCHMTEAWATAIVKRHARLLSPGAPLVTAPEWVILGQQIAACDALGLPHHTLHRWRDTYAVTALVRGDDPQFVKQQLGHAPNSPLLHTRYGVYIAMGRRHRSVSTTHRASRGER